MTRRVLTLCCWIALILLLAGCAGTPAAAPATPSGDAASLIQQAKTAMDAGQTDQAISTLQQVLQSEPDLEEAHFLLGNAYAKQDQFTQAETQYLETLKLNPDHVDARSNLGVTYYREGKLDEAEKMFREALSKQPNDAEIHYNLGGVLAARNQLDEAITEFLKAKELNPSLPEVYLGLGSVYQLQGKKAEAVEALREYLTRSNDPTWRAKAEQMLRELGASQ